jgi:hypothetical protein
LALFILGSAAAAAADRSVRLSAVFFHVPPTSSRDFRRLNVSTFPVVVRIPPPMEGLKKFHTLQIPERV